AVANKAASAKAPSKPIATGRGGCFAPQRDPWPKPWIRRWEDSTGVCGDELEGWPPTWRWPASWRNCSTVCCATGRTTSRKDSKCMKPKFWKPKRVCCANSLKSKDLRSFHPHSIKHGFMGRVASGRPGDSGGTVKMRPFSRERPQGQLIYLGTAICCRIC